MFEFRVTKYNPAYRSLNGAYTREEWISISDISRSFAGVVLTESDYLRIEEAYIESALAFLREANIPALTVAGLENHSGHALEISDGADVSLEVAGGILRRLLRGDFWCRLEGETGFVHIGYDFYMYVGVPHPCSNAAEFAHGLGLFVEPFGSPYLKR